MAEAESNAPPVRCEPAWGIVERHLALAATLARPFRRFRVPLEDLEAEGRLGLFQAALRFDPAQNVRFPTYASFWVLKRIREALAAYATVVRVPRSRSGPRRAAVREVSLDEPVPWDDELHLLDLVPQTLFPLPDHAAAGKESVALLARLLESLPARERALLVLRFGLDGEAPRPLGEIAAAFGVSRERVHQIERRAIARLRKAAPFR